jgi:hypothetical protein
MLIVIKMVQAIDCCLIVLILVLLIIAVTGMYTDWTFKSESFGNTCNSPLGPLCKIFDNSGMECTLLPSLLDPDNLLKCGSEMMTQEMWGIVDPHLLLSDPFYDGIEASGKPVVVEGEKADNNDWISGVLLKPDTSDQVLINLFNASINSPNYSKFNIIIINRKPDSIKVQFFSRWDTQYDIIDDNPIPVSESITIWKYSDNDAFNSLNPLTCEQPPTEAPTNAPTVPIADVQLTNCNSLKFRVGNVGDVDITNQKVINHEVNWSNAFGYLGFDILFTTVSVFPPYSTFNIFRASIEEDCFLCSDDVWTISLSVNGNNEASIIFNDNDYSKGIKGTFNKLLIVPDTTYHLAIHIGNPKCYVGLIEYDNINDRNVVAAREQRIAGHCMESSGYLSDLRNFKQNVKFGQEDGIIDIKEIDLCGVNGV